MKGGVVASVEIPTPDCVRFATHYRFSLDFCHAADLESKGIVEHLVGYAKRDLPRPAVDAGLSAWNEAAGAWRLEVNAADHAEVCAVPAERLDIERPLLTVLPLGAH